jgi:TolB-like protein
MKNSTGMIRRVALGLFAFVAGAGLAQTAKDQTIAVMKLQASGVDEAEAELLASRLNSELVAEGTYRVVERARVEDLLQEMGLQQSGACDADQCVAEVGKMLGVKFMVGGTVGRIGETYVLDTRLIEVSTGRIIRTTKDNYQGQVDGLLEILRDVARKIAGWQVTPQTKPPASGKSAARPTEEATAKKDRPSIQMLLGYGRNSSSNFMPGPSFAFRFMQFVGKNMLGGISVRFSEYTTKEIAGIMLPDSIVNDLAVTANFQYLFLKDRFHPYLEAGAGYRSESEFLANGNYLYELGGGAQIDLGLIMLNVELAYARVLDFNFSQLQYTGGLIFLF